MLMFFTLIFINIVNANDFDTVSDVDFYKYLISKNIFCDNYKVIDVYDYKNNTFEKDIQMTKKHYYIERKLQTYAKMLENKHFKSFYDLKYTPEQLNRKRDIMRLMCLEMLNLKGKKLKDVFLRHSYNIRSASASNTTQDYLKKLFDKL